jgi:hypothetical protein
MAPRGLITILLFFSIPETLAVAEFNEGILLLVILTSSITMAVSMIRYRKNAQQDVTLEVNGGTEDQFPAESSPPLEE